MTPTFFSPFPDSAPRSRRPQGIRLIVSGVSRDTSWQVRKSLPFGQVIWPCNGLLSQRPVIFILVLVIQWILWSCAITLAADSAPYTWIEPNPPFLPLGPEGFWT